MREIKFRGKREDDGEWVYGVPVFFPDNSVYLVRIGWMMLEKTSIIPETLGQYTGLHDRNGKEIYKGDVLKEIENISGFHDIFIVEWYTDDIHCGWSISPSDVWFSEVIGNIYDNPELLDERRQE